LLQLSSHSKKAEKSAKFRVWIKVPQGSTIIFKIPKVLPSITNKIGADKYGRRSHLFLTTINKALWDLFQLTLSNHRSRSVFT